MTISPPCASSAGSQSFELLHPAVQRWVWEQRWNELRDIQAATISAVIQSQADIIVSAATAAGKTEAAFLPIFSVVADLARDQLSVLYVGPLKALINDQFGRLEGLCEQMDIEVARWHGDAPQSRKAALIKRPRGVALITPESIEALLDRRPEAARRMFAGLKFIVIDELHAFLQGPRGLHLFSLLQRIERFAEHRPRRIGLSATLGDVELARAWINAAAPQTVTIVRSDGGPAIDLRVRAFVEPPDMLVTGDDSTDPPSALDRIADDLFARLRGSSNLVFAGSRRKVEALADGLRLRSERANVPNEFMPHHGSLSRELREDLEHRLKAGDNPTTAVATTTLELGIDIGSVKSVALVGAPRSMSGLRQKLGRSGRRKGTSAVLRIYLECPCIDEDSDLLDRMSLPVALTVGAIDLLRVKRIEPPSPDANVATVVLQQILSIIVERGGATADRLFADLCSQGPLSALDKSNFVALLHSMAAPDRNLIEQAPDQTIMLGREGEKVTASHDFYAIFPSDAEWRLIHGETVLGTLPISNAVGVGSIVGFAGRRWRVVEVDDLARVLMLAPHPSTRLPSFDGGGEGLHDILAAAARDAYRSTALPEWLDETTQRLLRDGRDLYAAHDLETQPLVNSGGSTHWFTWRGTSFNSALAGCLRTIGCAVEPHDVGVTVLGIGEAELRDALGRQSLGLLTTNLVADHVANLSSGKYDHYIDMSLLRTLWARRNATYVDQAVALLREMADRPVA